MISTLSDGIFLRRCLEFVFNAEVEHVLFTDSSSGRQLAMRQRTGKVKHLSGKVLWIQDAVRNGIIQLSQIPAMWNVSDIGTKALGVQRTQLLLHELNIASSPDFFVVGMPEYERQCQRHGGNKQLTKLVKHVTRILVMMGLESSTVPGVAAVSSLDCDESSSFGTCMVEPNVQVSGGGNFSYVAMAFFFGVLIGLLVVLYKTYKRARDAFESYECTLKWRSWILHTADCRISTKVSESNISLTICWINVFRKSGCFRDRLQVSMMQCADFEKHTMKWKENWKWYLSQQNRYILV
jgi:hypothetical protein